MPAPQDPSRCLALHKHKGYSHKRLPMTLRKIIEGSAIKNGIAPAIDKLQ